MSSLSFSVQRADGGDDPILDARTVAALMTALNQAYGWTLPTGFPGGTVLEDLWEFQITVAAPQPPGTVLYRATSTRTWQVTTGLDGTVHIDVVEAPDGGSG